MKKSKETEPRVRDNPHETPKVMDVKLDLIDQNENSRVVYKEADLSELMASMSQDGLLHPVGLKRIAGNRFEAVYGNRRILAAKKLGWYSIAASIRDNIKSDVDRDMANMIENIKRKNTSVAEDGRMFQLFLDRGLSISEVAARLGITKDRVIVALDVIRKVPEDIQRKIKHRPGGGGRASTAPKKGEIAASTAAHILSLQRQNNISKEDTRKLFDFAAQDGTNRDQLISISPLIKRGYSVPLALALAQQCRSVVVKFILDKKSVQALEKKTGKQIGILIYDLVAADKRFKLAPDAIKQLKDKLDDEAKEEPEQADLEFGT